MLINVMFFPLEVFSVDIILYNNNEGRKETKVRKPGVKVYIVIISNFLTNFLMGYINNLFFVVIDPSNTKIRRISAIFVCINQNVLHSNRFTRF